MLSNRWCPLLQVGILLHYSTLATALWVGVTSRNIYKQLTRKAKRYEELDEPPPPPRPMLRYRHGLWVSKGLSENFSFYWNIIALLSPFYLELLCSADLGLQQFQ